MLTDDASEASMDFESPVPVQFVIFIFRSIKLRSRTLRRLAVS